MISIIGHRGAAGLELENSITGFLKALEVGVDMIEIDVWKTSDDVFVVFHDALLDRITDREGYIYKRSLEELKDVTLKNGDRIMLLTEICQFCKERNVKLFIEVKNDDSADKIQEVASVYLDYTDYIIGSFYHEQIVKLKKNKKYVQGALIVEGVMYDLKKYLLNSGVDYIAVGFESVNEHLISISKECGLKIVFWTVDIEEDMKKAIGYSPFGIITNYPDTLKRIMTMSPI